MNEQNSNREARPVEMAIGKAEIAAGVLLFVYATLSPMISRFYPALEPDLLFGIWPLILLFTGFGLVTAGGRLVKGAQWPYLWHIPLALWIALVMAFVM